MDPLIEIPRYKWPQLRELYRTTWPEGTVPSCIMDTQMSYPALTDAFHFKVYCPAGKITTGMVAIADPGEKAQLEVMIHPIDKDSKEIEEAFLTTSLIDWNRDVIVPSASSEAIAILERIKDPNGLKVHYGDDTKGIKHLFSRHSTPFEDLTCPSKTYVGPLKPEHIDLIDTTWTYHNNSSHQMFENLMNNNLTYVLYSADQQPLAWVTVNAQGALTHLYCLEVYRRKGYSEFLTKYVANDLLRKGKDVLAYTIEGNVKPQNLFKKLGFENIGFDHWVFINKDK